MLLFLGFLPALYILKYYGAVDTIPVKLYILTHLGFMIFVLKEITQFCFYKLTIIILKEKEIVTLTLWS